MRHPRLSNKVQQLSYLWPRMNDFSFATTWQTYRYLHALKIIQQNMLREGYTDPIRYASERITFFPLLVLVRARFASESEPRYRFSKHCRQRLRINSYTFNKMKRTIRCLS